jgi:hypothetical protein
MCNAYIKTRPDIPKHYIILKQYLGRPKPSAWFSEEKGLSLKGKNKAQPRIGHGDPVGGGGLKYYSTISIASALDRVPWSTPRPSRFTPGKEPVHIVQGVR